MTKTKIEKLVRELIDTFLHAGEVSLSLRKNGLTKKIKPDNTPVSNGDLEVNNILIKKIKELTPSIPIISEEVSDNKGFYVQYLIFEQLFLHPLYPVLSSIVLMQQPFYHHRRVLKLCL